VYKLPGEGLGVALDMPCTLAAASLLVSSDPLWTTEDCAITEELVSLTISIMRTVSVCFHGWVADLPTAL
jgi:hypothetical protein